MRQNQGKPNNDLTATYHIADLDVINYTDKVKEGLMKHFKADSALRSGSAATQVTLATLAGAAETAGWSVSTASGLGLAAGYIFSLGQVFNAKDKAQAYEQAFTAVQAAEATYYFYRLGMSFNTVGGRTVVLRGDSNGRDDVPSSTHLTPDGETLYYRVSKVLKVLDDALANKIPDLQDLKDAKGDGGGSAASPAKFIPTSSASGGGPGGHSSETTIKTNVSESAPTIPAQFAPRNERLRLAFPSSEDDAKTHIEAAGLFVPGDTTPREYLAKSILAKADLLLLKAQKGQKAPSAIDSLTFYRQHATDEAAIAKLEKAYRKFTLIPPASE